MASIDQLHKPDPTATTPVDLTRTNPPAIPLLRAVSSGTKDDIRSVTSLLGRDNYYHARTASLTASENYVSFVVRLVSAHPNGSFYYFAPPYTVEGTEWNFANSGAPPELAAKFRDLMKDLYGAGTADWRANGGSACEQAVVLACCQRGQAFMQLGHRDGGHFGVDGLAAAFGIEALDFPMYERDGLIDVERAVAIIKQRGNVTLALLNPSHGLRQQPIEELSQALPPGVTLSVDASHTAGLIVGGKLGQPLLLGARVLHFNTHKTLPGPNKGVIALADESDPLARRIFDRICPEIQSNSHSECLPGLVLALQEQATYGRQYAEQTVTNARVLARALDHEGLRVQGMEFGGTETHQCHVVLGPAEKSHEIANDRLPRCGIRTNSVVIPGAGGEFGLRLGAQALTRRGLAEAEFAEIGRLLAGAVLGRLESDTVQYEIAALLEAFPLYPLRFSFDELGDDDVVRELLSEVLP